MNSSSHPMRRSLNARFVHCSTLVVWKQAVLLVDQAHQTEGA